MITQSILHDDMNSHTLPIIRLRALEPEDLDMLYKIENDYQLWGVGATMCHTRDMPCMTILPMPQMISIQTSR